MNSSRLIETHNAVHPRARGEHQRLDDFFVHGAGSSPRTRGTFCQRLFNRCDRRFIPAHAGNIPVSASVVGLETVHPRARGEHVRYRHGTQGLSGSSPRTRGTWSDEQSDHVRLRFIPAHAGNIATMALTPPITSGSSPRTRGTYTDPSATV